MYVSQGKCTNLLPDYKVLTLKYMRIGERIVRQIIPCTLPRYCMLSIIHTHYQILHSRNLHQIRKEMHEIPKIGSYYDIMGEEWRK